ncbi:MAG: cation:proton antiporter [Fimbriimonas sp.]
MIEVATLGAMGILMVALFLAVFRLVRGPSLPDRVVALDLIGVISLGIILVLTIRTNEPVYLDVAIVLGIMAFMGTVAFARYLERVAER